MKIHSITMTWSLVVKKINELLLVLDDVFDGMINKRIWGVLLA